MRLLRVLVVSWMLLGLLVPTVLAGPKPDAAHIPHEILPDDAEWAAGFGETTFADLWEDLMLAPWGRVMELAPSTRTSGDVFRGPVDIGFTFHFMQGPASGVPSYRYDPTCGGMYPRGRGPGCYVAYKWSYRLRDAGYTVAFVSPHGLLVFAYPKTDKPPSWAWPSGGGNYAPLTVGSPEPPNNYIAPFWTDLLNGSNDYRDAGIIWNADHTIRGSFDNGWVRRPRGRILYATLGVAPNRKFVVEWLNARHNETGFLCTFELQLFEGSNAILFLYKDFEGKPGNPDWFSPTPIALGMEDFSGTLFVGDFFVNEWQRLPSPAAAESMRGFVY